MFQWTKMVSLFLAFWVPSASFGAGSVSGAPEELPNNILFRNLGGDPESLDPQKAMGHPDYMVTNDLFEGLVSFNAKGEIVPGVAYKWTVSEDKLTWTFHLRKEARWSNGEPVTAHDFVYALSRPLIPANGCKASSQIFDIKNAFAFLKGEVKDLSQVGLKAVNDHTLEIQLEKPIPYLLDLLASDNGFPVHRRTLEKYPDSWARPGRIVSNGPFILTEWNINEFIKLSKNPFYWDKNRVQLEHVHYLSLADEAVELKLFRTGKIDIGHHNLQDKASLDFVRSKAPETIKISPVISISVFVFAVDRAAVKDVRIREALNLCIDRKLLTDRVLFPGTGIPADSFALPGVKNKLNSHIGQRDLTREQQIQRARQLYKEAGYSEKKPLKVVLFLPNKANRVRVAIALADMIRHTLGAEVVLEKKEFKIYSSQKGKDLYDMYDLGRHWGYGDVIDLLEQFSSLNGMKNVARYHNPEYEKLLEKARYTKDFGERDKILDQACALLFSEQVVAPLFFNTHTRLVHPRVQGFYENHRGVHPSCYITLDSNKGAFSF